MPTSVLLSKVSSEGATQVESLVETDKEFEPQLNRQCPGVKRTASYALLGACDFLHIFETTDARKAAQVALLANSLGVATTQTLSAIPFSEFQEIVEGL